MKSWRNNLLAWSLMLSGLGTILLLMGSTFYVVVVQSLGYFNLEGESHFSLEFWRNMLQDEVLHSALFYSVKVSVLGAFGSVIFAYPLARSGCWHMGHLLQRLPAAAKTEFFGSADFLLGEKSRRIQHRLCPWRTRFYYRSDHSLFLPRLLLCPPRCSGGINDSGDPQCHFDDHH